MSLFPHPLFAGGKRAIRCLAVHLAGGLAACLGGADDQPVRTLAVPPETTLCVEHGRPAGNDGRTTLTIKATGSVRWGYLRFDIGSLPGVGSARLRLYVDHADTPSTLTVYGLPNDGWSGQSPNGGPPGIALGRIGVNEVSPHQPARYYEADVTAFVSAPTATRRRISFGIESDSPAPLELDGRDSPRSPQLIVTTPGPWSPGAQNTNRGGKGASGTVYYIDALHGDDLRPGTSPAAAWKTAGKVNSFPAIPGDAFLFRAEQTFTADPGSKATLVTRPGRDSAARVIYGSYDPSGVGRGRATILAPGGGLVARTNAITLSNWTEVRDLVVSGTSILGNYHEHPDQHGQWLVEGRCSDVLIENLTVSRGAVGISGLSSLYRDQSARWEIRDSTVYGVGGTGIYVYGDNFVVRNCLVSDWALESEKVWAASQHGIYSRARHLEAYGSEFARYQPSIATTGQAISPRGRDNIIDGNRIHDIATVAIGFFPDDSNAAAHWGTGRSVIRHNTFWNIGNAVFFAYSNQGSLAEHWLAYNNTAAGMSATSPAVAFAWDHLTGGAIARNNAVTAGYTAVARMPASGGLASDHNRVGTGAQLGIPEPPTSPSVGIQWVPAPKIGSPLIHQGTAITETGTADSPAGRSPPNIGSICTP